MAHAIGVPSTNRSGPPQLTQFLRFQGSGRANSAVRTFYCPTAKCIEAGIGTYRLAGIGVDRRVANGELPRPKERRGGLAQRDIDGILARRGGWRSLVRFNARRAALLSAPGGRRRRGLHRQPGGKRRRTAQYRKAKNQEARKGTANRSRQKLDLLKCRRRTRCHHYIGAGDHAPWIGSSPQPITTTGWDNGIRGRFHEWSYVARRLRDL